MNKRNIFGYYLSDKRLSSALDLIRFYTQPDYFRETHLTIKVLKSRMHQETLCIQKISTFITIQSPNVFFNDDQNTVYLQCDVRRYKSVVHKPDYPDSIPHITLYDSNSRSEANEIFSLISLYNWDILAKTTELMAITPKKHISEVLSLYYQDLSSSYQEIFGKTFNPSSVPELSFDNRLAAIERICDFIEKNYMKRTSIFVNNQSYEPQLLAG